MILFRTYETLFLPAQKARRLIQNDFNQVFKHPNLLYSQQVTKDQETVDVLLVPSATSPAPLLNDTSKKQDGVNEYLDDVMTLPANLAGIPAITVPFKDSKYPIGLQLLGQYGYDKFVLHVAKKMMHS